MKLLSRQAKEGWPCPTCITTFGGNIRFTMTPAPDPKQYLFKVHGFEAWHSGPRKWQPGGFREIFGRSEIISDKLSQLWASTTGPEGSNYCNKAYIKVSGLLQNPWNFSRGIPGTLSNVVAVTKARGLSSRVPLCAFPSDQNHMKGPPDH